MSTVTELRVDVFERDIRLPGRGEESLTATTLRRLQLELSSQMIRSLLYAQAGQGRADISAVTATGCLNKPGR
jgi:hypothetical protein